MQKAGSLIGVLVALLASAHLQAQEATTQPPPPHTETPHAQKSTVPRWRSEVRLQGLYFGNFFQSTNPADEEDVHALSAAYRATYRTPSRPLDVYGQVDYLNYTDIDRDSSYGGRVGALYDGVKHDFEGYIDRAENRAAFDVGNRTAIANITTLSGDYSYRVVPDWQLGLETLHERQRFDVSTDRANDYSSFGGSVRYRGFGYKFMPKVGYVVGERDVDNRVDSYDDRYWYLQVTSAPTPKTYVSVRFRDRDRKHTVPNSSGIREQDSRKQWTAFVGYRLNDRFGLGTYYSQESTEVPGVGRDYDTSFLMLGLTVHF